MCAAFRSAPRFETTHTLALEIPRVAAVLLDRTQVCIQSVHISQQAMAANKKRSAIADDVKETTSSSIANKKRSAIADDVKETTSSSIANKKRRSAIADDVKETTSLDDLMVGNTGIFVDIVSMLDNSAVCALIASDFNYEIFLLETASKRSGCPEPVRWGG
jgi:hypothetical protein